MEILVWYLRFQTSWIQDFCQFFRVCISENLVSEKKVSVEVSENLVLEKKVSVSVLENVVLEKNLGVAKNFGAI